MNNLIRKKIILCLLDSASKSADEIAGEIDASLTTVADQLTALVSEGICEEVNPDEISQYVVRKDIETFAQLVKEFLSSTEGHEQETERFISTEHYFTRIDYELVDYVLSRFYLSSVYRTDDNKEGLRRILLVSPSALFLLCMVIRHCFVNHGQVGISWILPRRLMTGSPNSFVHHSRRHYWKSSLLICKFSLTVFSMLNSKLKWQR